VLRVLLLQLLQLCLLGSNHRCWQALLRAYATPCQELQSVLPPSEGAPPCCSVKQLLHYAVCIPVDPPSTESASHCVFGS
jgi:hypothetical protein